VLVGDNGDNSFSATRRRPFIGKGGNDFIDAIDGKHDKVINWWRRVG